MRRSALKAAQSVVRKRIAVRSGAAGQARRLQRARIRRARELFLVEGDSAGGSAKQARDKDFQAIMPLRGKILNTWELEPGEIGSSRGSAQHQRRARRRSGLRRPVSELRYHKICILADADSDGQHIATLLCALFLRHFRPLVAQRPRATWPCRRCTASMPASRCYYALDDAERDAGAQADREGELAHQARR